MNDVKFRESSWHAQFYLWFNDYLPSNFCPYFWKILFYLLTFPICWAGAFVKKNWQLGFFCTILIYVLLCAAEIFGLMILVGDPNNLNLNEVSWLHVIFAIPALAILILVGLFIIFIGVAVLQLILYMFQLIYSKIKSEKSLAKKEPSLIRVKWDSFYHKYCPKITWKR